MSAKMKPASLFRLSLAAAALLCGLGAATARADDLPWNEFRFGDSALGFHGYFRSSVGAALKDGDILPVFIAPGAQSKYRLGNESDTNVDVGLDYHYYLDGIANKKSRYIQLLGMLSDYDSNPDYEDVELKFRHDKIPQAFVRYGNALGDGVNVWFGRRNYDRRDIHIIDHFWLNVAQGSEYGGGVEGIPAGVGRLDVAAFTNRDRNVADRGGAPGVNDSLYSRSLDLRYRGIPTNKGGDLTLWGFGVLREANDRINFGTRTGFALGGWHTQQDVMDGRLVSSFTYRKGVALQQGMFDSRPIREGQGYDLSRAYTMEFNTDWLAEYKDRHFAVQWVGVARREDRGLDGAGGDTIDWLSTGARPVFFLTEHVSIATEFGVDYVNNKIIDASGFLGKGTIALQLTPKKGFFKRPMIRIFATGALWSDSFRGRVGNGSPAAATSYADDTAGTSVGIQFEHWW